MTTVEPLLAAPVAPLPQRATSQAMLMPSIRVNLLPAEVVLARRARRARRYVVVVLAALVVGLAAASLLARAGVGGERDELAAAAAVNTNLVAQQSRYADVVAAQAAVEAVQQRTRALTATDVGWAALTRAVIAAAPSGVTATDIAGLAAVPVAGAITVTAPTAADPAAGAGATAAVATLAVTGSAADPTLVALFVERLAATTGLSTVTATSVDLVDDGGGYTFTVTADVTAAALAPRAGAGTGR